MGLPWQFTERFITLSSFIAANIKLILDEWDGFARTIVSTAGHEKPKLSDNAAMILWATVCDLDPDQSTAKRWEKSQGQHALADGSLALNAASELHVVGRLGVGFNMLEVMSEYRALRASVPRKPP